MKGDNDVIRVYSNQPMWVFEAESTGQVRLAGVSQAILCGRSLAKVVGPQCYRVEVVALIQHEDVERIVLSRIRKGYARRSYGIWESDVQYEIRVIGVGSLADVRSAKAQDMVVLQYPPEEGSWGLVVFSVVYVGGGG